MKIAFASCMNIAQCPEQTVWRDLANTSPDYLFLLGDQIYMDFYPHLLQSQGWEAATFEREMDARYKRQFAEPNFAALLASVRQRQGVDGGVYGTWDDHDFAWNDANGSEVPADKQAISRRLHALYVRGQQAAPAQMYFSLPLVEAGLTVATAIFLDTRSHSQPLGETNDLLGEAQFAWLTDQLANAQGQIIVCAGMPMRATGKGWTRYGRDTQRFIELVRDRQVLFLTGDIHENAFIAPTPAMPLYEIVSSGAAVIKYVITGKRRNFGLLELLPDQIHITLFERHQTKRYAINRRDFTASEVE